MKKLILALLLVSSVAFGAQRWGLESFVRNVVTPGTKIPLTTYPTSARGVVIRAKGSNTAHIYLGGSQSAARGSALSLAASTAIEIPSTGRDISLEKIFIDGEASGDGVEVIYEESYD